MSDQKTIADLIEHRYGISSGAGADMPAEGELASILSHRTHRRFTDQPVSDALLEVLLAAAFSAPAKSDLQQGAVVVIRDPEKRKAIADLMESFKSGSMTLSADALQKAQALFTSYRLNDDEVLKVIADTFESTEYLLDPHTAIGVEAARKTRRSADVPMICLATAHPAKFPEAIQKAGCEDPALPHHMKDLFEREERYQVIEQDLGLVQHFITENVRP